MSITYYYKQLEFTGVRSWFGLVEQCSYSFSKTEAMEPFRHLLKPDTPFTWTQELEEALKLSKEEIIRKVEHGIETMTSSPELSSTTETLHSGTSGAVPPRL